MEESFIEERRGELRYAAELDASLSRINVSTFLVRPTKIKCSSAQRVKCCTMSLAHSVLREQ